jgi:hypothetical protein
MKYLRKKDLAKRYSITDRNVDYMVKDGRLPAPFYRGRFPLLDPDQVDAADRAALIASRASKPPKAVTADTKSEATAAYPTT